MRLAIPLLSTLLVSCLSADRQTLSRLHRVEPDMQEARVDDGLDQAMVAYRRYLEEAPESSLTPEAMRRLADLKLEKDFGILGETESSTSLPAPEMAAPASGEAGAATAGLAAGERDADRESQQEFEERTLATALPATAPTAAEAAPLPGGEQVVGSGPEEAIALYDRILATYPDYVHNDRVLYQKARAFDELGRNDEAIVVMAALIERFPHSRYIDEVQFRRGEYFFMRRKYLDAEDAYGAVIQIGSHSDFYELALYKLGWTFYKQELHEEALQRYVALLDYKLSTGYDFDQAANEEEERRIADTYRVISLSFSAIGGPQAVAAYFEREGQRSYEDRIYRHLGEFYLEKLRYHDAAVAYRTFIDLHPLHRLSPRFSMRIVEIYEKGGFPRLVLESKKTFAGSYGLQAPYWRDSGLEVTPEVLEDLKGNLHDLANHYHAVFQAPELAKEREASFAEAQHWYGAYLASFPAEPETPGIHYRMADLLLEHEDFGPAARAYEHTAYEYPEHEQSAAAGYAAIFAHREHQKSTPAEAVVASEAVTREVVQSTLRFVDTFPEHEHAAAVLGAAVDDLYAMEAFEQTISTGRRLIDEYPESEMPIRRSAWLAVAHASLDTSAYEEAEHAYLQVLEMTTAEDESRQAVVDNLAAAVYKQGELASQAGEHRAAADHFLRITRVASTSGIRPVAEYDAGAALMRLEDWAGAAAVFEAFRLAHPAHELNREATKQMAFVYREQGELARSAQEYERVAAESDDEDLRREALLAAGELYEDAGQPEQALGVYGAYLKAFPRPLETAVEIRFKMAGIHEASGDTESRLAELRRIVKLDRSAGAERSDRVRYLAALSALVFSERLYERFLDVKLVQPLERNLQKKQRRLDEARRSFEALVDYEVGEVTAAATFYVAELFSGFGAAMLDSERPAELGGSQLLEYEMALEEEAFPFEERAIEVHEKNLELMGAGVFNGWIEKSLGRLAVLMPGRYAKFEASSGLMASLDTYAYRSPRQLALAAEGAPAEPAPEAGEGSADPAAPEASELPAAPAAPAPTSTPEGAPSDAESGGEAAS